MSWLPLLFVIPVVTGFVGWVTNWLAVRMIFWPKELVGIGRFGWQGIIYRHNRKFAVATADLASGTLLSPRDITDRLDADELVEIYQGAFDAEAKTILRACWDVVVPGLWERVPEVVQDVIVGQVRRDGADALREIYRRFRRSRNRLIDLNGLAVDVLTRDGGRSMARIVQEFGATELRFIIRYGAVFGTLIGVVEVFLWGLLRQAWLLPIVGGLVGAATNWLAIQMIFRPYRPTTYFGLVTYQGLFPRRQKEIARDYAAVTAREVVTAHNLIGMLTHGEGGERLAKLVADTLSKRVDARVDSLTGPLPLLFVGPVIDRIKETIFEQVMAALPHLRPELEAYLDRKLDVETLIRERMSKLSKRRFERILRGVFEEDERTLIAIGGALGTLIGFAQAVVGYL